MVVELFAQSPPVELHERVLLGNFAHHPVRDTRMFPESRQVKLFHFFAAAHVVHQIKAVPFAANDGNNLTSMEPLYL
jgi:hypothetical protein